MGRQIGWWPLCCLPSYHNMSWDLRGGPYNNMFVLLFSISKERDLTENNMTYIFFYYFCVRFWTVEKKVSFSKCKKRMCELHTDRLIINY
jgi:hypothetical protein